MHIRVMLSYEVVKSMCPQDSKTYAGMVAGMVAAFVRRIDLAISCCFEWKNVQKLDALNYFLTTYI